VVHAFSFSCRMETLFPIKPALARSAPNVGRHPAWRLANGVSALEERCRSTAATMGAALSSIDASERPVVGSDERPSYDGHGSNPDVRS
jgi:hypothetical protein